MILKTKSKEYEKWRVTIVLYWGAFLLFFASCNTWHVKLRQGQVPNSTMFEFKSNGFVIKCGKNDLRQEMNNHPKLRDDNLFLFLEQISDKSTLIRISDISDWDQKDRELFANTYCLQMAAFLALKNGNATVFNTQTQKNEQRIKVIRSHKKNFLLHTPNGEYIGEIVNIIAD